MGNLINETGTSSIKMKRYIHKNTYTYVTNPERECFIHDMEVCIKQKDEGQKEITQDEPNSYC